MRVSSKMLMDFQLPMSPWKSRLFSRASSLIVGLLLASCVAGDSPHYKHVKRHHYVAVHRHESMSTLTDAGTTSLPQNAQDSAAPPTHAGIDDEYFNRNPCTSKYCGAGRECQVSPDGRVGLCICAKRCARRHRPVCGSDGKVYANHCELHRAACNLGTPLTASRLMRCLHRVFT